MADISTDEFRSLIRLVSPLRALAKNVEQSLHLDMFRGTSKLLVKNYSSIHETVSGIIGDAYTQSLALDLDEEATEREIVSQVSLAAGQLLAYLVSYTGVPEAQQGGTHINAAPSIVVNASGSSEENKERIVKMVEDAVNNQRKD